MAGIEQHSAPTRFGAAIPETVPIDPLWRAQVLATGIRRTGHPTEIDGSQRSYYFDVDYLTHPVDNTVRHFRVAILNAVEAVVAVHPVNAIACHVRRGGGPIGVGTLSYTLHRQLELPLHSVDPRARLFDRSLNPKFVRPPAPEVSKMLILTDMTATGEEVVDAARVLWRRSIREICAVSLFDTREGARENLDQYGIPLTTIMTSADVTN